MTYNVFGGMLNLAQSINHYELALTLLFIHRF